MQHSKSFCEHAIRPRIVEVLFPVHNGKYSRCGQAVILHYYFCSGATSNRKAQTTQLQKFCPVPVIYNCKQLCKQKIMTTAILHMAKFFDNRTRQITGAFHTNTPYARLCQLAAYRLTMQSLLSGPLAETTIIGP